MDNYRPELREDVAWPLRSDGRLGGWQVAPGTLIELNNRGMVSLGRFDPERRAWTVRYLKKGPRSDIESGALRVKGREDDAGPLVLEYSGESPTKWAKTVWCRRDHDAGVHGTGLLESFVEGRKFDFPKSLYAVADTLSPIVGDNPDAVILDFFAGSGTTLHAAAIINEQDGGSRQCILVTNNDLSTDDAKEANGRRLYPGDRGYESLGIFESVTRPRVEAALSGMRPDGRPVGGDRSVGDYKTWYLPDHPFSAGLAGSAEFFELEYMERDLVDLGLDYERILPVLWLRAGGVGTWEEALAGQTAREPWTGPGSSNFAVLFEPGALRGFAGWVEECQRVTHVWVESDSPTILREVRAVLPRRVEHVGALYGDYLREVVGRPRRAAL